MGGVKRRTRNRPRPGKRHFVAAFVVLVFIGIGLSLASFKNLPVLADGSQVNAVLCDASSSPELIVTSPVSDSVTNSSLVHVIGTASLADHLDIFVNASLATSLTIGSSEQFDAPITLTKGTHTIKLDASYSCNGNHTLATIIVTYEPAAVPSIGSTVNTELPAIPSIPPLPVSRSAPQSAQTAQPTPPPPSRSQPTFPSEETTGPSIPSEPQPRSLLGTLFSFTTKWLPRFLAIIGFVMLFAPRWLLNKISRNTKVQPIIRLTGAILIPLGTFLLWQGVIEVLGYNNFHG